MVKNCFKHSNSSRGTLFIRTALTICSTFGALKYFKYVLFGYFFFGFDQGPDCNDHLIKVKVFKLNVQREELECVKKEAEF